MHKDVMRGLRKTKSYVAAANYASAIIDHVEKDPPMVDLVKEVMKWPAKKSEAGRRKDILLEGARAALQRKDKKTAVKAWNRAQAIPGTAQSDYHAIDRKVRYKDPFSADKDLRKRIEALAAR